MQGPHISSAASSIFSGGPDALYWLLLLFIAIFSDLLLGQFLKGRIPNLDQLLSTAAARLSEKLDRHERSDSALRTRGLLALAACLPVLVFLGGLLNLLAQGSAAGTAVALLILIPLTAQKPLWLEHTKTGRRISKDTAVADPHKLAQISSQTVILRFATHFLPTVILFGIGGFAALIPYRFGANLLQAGILNNKRLSPFFTYAKWLYELVTFPIAVLASILLGLSHFFIPRTNLGVFFRLKRNTTSTLASHFLPLNIMANGSGLSFHRKEGPKTKMATESKWIGPENGRAKLTTNDMRSIWLVVLVAFGLTLILLAMLFVYLSVNYANEL